VIITDDQIDISQLVESVVDKWCSFREKVSIDDCLLKYRFLVISKDDFANLKSWVDQKESELKEQSSKT